MMPHSTPKSTPKGMSSRLATMKFMQRGAAVQAAEASSPATPTTEAEMGSSAKRRKFSHANSPAVATPNTPLYDQQAIQRALEEEERKRQEAIDKRAAELGDEHWVLDTSYLPASTNIRPQMKVVTVGFAQIDNATSESDDDMTRGDQISVARRRFNMKAQACSPEPDEPLFKRRSDGRKLTDKQVIKRDEVNNESSDDSESSSEDESDEDSPRATDQSDRGRRGAHATPRNDKRARSIVSARESAERKKAQEFAGKRRNKDVKLNTLTSLSAGGNQNSRSSASKMSCYGCGKAGHKAADCPSKKRR